MGLLSGITDAIGLTDSGAVKKSMRKSEGATKEQLARLDAIDIPDIEKQRLLLENPELVGLLEAEQLGDSALEQINLDPKAKEAQLNALASLQNYADEGVTDTDKYAMEQMLSEVGAATKSNQAAIEADMARKGMDSSGAALMSKMNAQQSGANNARQQAMQQAAQGQQNRMNALSQLATQSGQMQQQDYNMQANAASAKDAIAKANAANRYQTNAANLSAKQSIENQRANLSNQEQIHNKGLYQTQFGNEMNKAGVQNQASGQLANMYANQGAAQAKADSATMGSIIGAAKGAFEDGGVAGNFQAEADNRKKIAQEKEDKQHDSFKQKYMKRVRNELLEKGERRDISSPAQHAEDGNVMMSQPSFESSGEGDIIDSGYDLVEGDRIDAKVNDKEIIVNLPQQQRLMDFIRGKISVDEIGNDDIIEGVPRDYRDELHAEKEDEGNLKAIEALLKKLGEA